MSYEIEYRRVTAVFDGRKAAQAINDLTNNDGAYRAPPDWFDRCAVTLLEQGSSNCFDDRGQRSRHWVLESCGMQHRVMERAVEMALYVEKGTTKPGGRDMKAENYISARRRDLKDGMPIEALFANLAGQTLEVSLHLFDEQKAASHPWWQKAVKAGWTYQPTYSAGGLRMPLVDRLDLECFLLTVPEIATGECSSFGTLKKFTVLNQLLGRMASGNQGHLDLAA